MRMLILVEWLQSKGNMTLLEARYIAVNYCIAKSTDDPVAAASYKT